MNENSKILAAVVVVVAGMFLVFLMGGGITGKFWIFDGDDEVLQTEDDNKVLQGKDISNPLGDDVIYPPEPKPGIAVPDTAKDGFTYGDGCTPADPNACNQAGCFAFCQAFCDVNICASIVCNDKDGRDTTVSSYCGEGRHEVWDRCLDSNTLQEAVCINECTSPKITFPYEPCAYEEIECPSGTSCSEGKCIHID